MVWRVFSKLSQYKIKQKWLAVKKKTNYKKSLKKLPSIPHTLHRLTAHNKRAQLKHAFLEIVVGEFTIGIWIMSLERFARGDN